MNQKVLEHYIDHFNKQVGQKYPCGNQIVLCGIITNNRDKALDFMKDKKIIEKREQQYQIDWVLDNGERWQWRKWNTNCRGCRFYKIAIDESISDELFKAIVAPYCSPYCCSMEIIK